MKTGVPFEFEGFWWIPDPDEPPARAAQGTVRYDPSTGVELSVVDLFDGPEGFLNHSPRLKALYGETLQGKPCTLLSPICRRGNGNLLGGHSHEVWAASRFIHGAHISTVDDLPVSRMRLNLRGLAEWLTARWPEKSMPFDENETVTVDLKAARLTFQLEEEELSERFSHIERQDYSALFEFAKPSTYSEIDEIWIRPLHDLLLLGTNEEIRVTETTVLVEEELETPLGDSFKQVKEIAVVQRSELVWHGERPNAFNEVPLPLAALGDDPNAAINAWYEMRDEIGGAGNGLFSALNRRYRTLEVELLSLLSAAEGYHRARLNSLVVPQQEHEEAVKAMIAALPPALKDNYEKRLGHANEQTQSQRMKELFKRAESVVPAIEKWRKSVRPLIQIRNFLAHLDPETDELPDIDTQIVLLKKLEIVLRINLMRDIGVDPVDIQRSVETAFGQHAVFAT